MRLAKRERKQCEYSRSGIFGYFGSPLSLIFPFGNNLLDFKSFGPYIPVREYFMTPEQIGISIRDMRKRQGLRQDQLAGAAGVGLRFLIELEGGKETAQLGKTLAVLNALGCKIELTGPEGKKS